MGSQIVNTVKNKDFINTILDKFFFSNLATFIVVFLGPLLSIITFLAKKVMIDKSGPRKTTINVAKLEKKNLSKIVLIKSLFLTVFTI